MNTHEASEIANLCSMQDILQDVLQDILQDILQDVYQSRTSDDGIQRSKGVVPLGESDFPSSENKIIKILLCSKTRPKI